MNNASVNAVDGSQPARQAMSVPSSRIAGARAPADNIHADNDHADNDHADEGRASMSSSAGDSRQPSSSGSSSGSSGSRGAPGSISDTSGHPGSVGGATQRSRLLLFGSLAVCWFASACLLFVLYGQVSTVAAGDRFARQIRPPLQRLSEQVIAASSTAAPADATVVAAATATIKNLLAAPPQELRSAMPHLRASWSAVDLALMPAIDHGDAAPRLLSTLKALLSRHELDMGSSPMSAGLSSSLTVLHGWERDLSAMPPVIPQDIDAQRLAIEKSMQAFAATPEASTDTPQTRAWITIAKAWTQVSQAATALAAAPSLSPAQATIVSAALLSFDAALAQARPPATQIGGGWLWLILSVAISLQILLLPALWLVFSRFQSNHQRNSAAMTARLASATSALTGEMELLAQGDLSLRQPPLPPAAVLAPLSDALLDMQKKLRSLLLVATAAIKQTGQACAKTSTASVSLLDECRAAVEGDRDRDATVNAIAAAAHEVNTANEQAAAGWGQAEDLLSALAKALEGGLPHLTAARTNADATRDRLARAKAAIEDLARQSTEQAEWTEQAEALAVQASLQASKAGERGRGFQRVADGLRAASSNLLRLAKHTSSNLQSALTDIVLSSDQGRDTETALDALAASYDSARTLVTQSAPLVQQMREHARTVGSLLEKQRVTVLSLQTHAPQDSQVLARLQSIAAETAQAILGMVDAARALEDSLGRLRL